jgi:hypothetical protein
MTGGGDSHGWGGTWVFALVIIFFALVFFRGGFGGREGGEHRVVVDGAGGAGAAAGAAFAEINGRFNEMGARITHSEDLAQLKLIQQQNCETNQNILKTGFELSKEILISNNALQRELADCCCTTQRGIDKLAYEGAKNTCEIITNSNNNTTKILAEMKQAEINALRDKLAERDLALSQCAQNATLIAALKPPCPIPAYPTCNPNWPPFAQPFGFDGRGRGGFDGCGNGGCFA